MHLIGDGGHARVVRENFQWQGDGVFIAVGDNASRKREYEANKGCFFPHYCCEHSVISPSARIGDGTIIMAGAVVQANARIGRFCIINTGATVDHDCVLEDFVHIAPGAHLCGGVHVGEGALVGVGVGIEPGVVIPKWSIVKRERYVITVPSNAGL